MVVKVTNAKIIRESAEGAGARSGSGGTDGGVSDEDVAPPAQARVPTPPGETMVPESPLHTDSSYVHVGPDSGILVDESNLQDMAMGSGLTPAKEGTIPEMARPTAEAAPSEPARQEGGEASSPEGGIGPPPGLEKAKKEEQCPVCGGDEPNMGSLLE